jgi:thermolysin
MTIVVRPCVGLLALALAGGPFSAAPAGQEAAPPGASPRVRTLAVNGDAAAGLAREIEDAQRTGRLRLASSVDDHLLAGRVHDRFDQYVGEARVYGAQLVRQRSADGVESVFAALHPDVALDPTPRIAAAAAAERVTAITGHAPLAGRAAELVVLPLDDGTYRLAWYLRVLTRRDLLAIFIDARTGEEVFRYSDLQTQSAVGTGTGVRGDRKKIATRLAGSLYLADDLLRPPSLVTYDLKGSPERTFSVLDGALTPGQSDVASDTDNTWTDGANVDAHVYTGYTYDYFFKRFQRRGLDGSDRLIRGIVHPANRDDLLTYDEDVVGLLILNAFWCGSCGADGRGYMVFGEGLPPRFFLTATGQTVTWFSGGFDIVSHELTHAVTEFSSGLIYRNESGALNEAFSDIMAVGADFFTAALGATTQPNYVVGEHVFTPFQPGSVAGTRSLADPRAFGDPDHYTRRYLGVEDNGGVHTNSMIAGHAFYLAIEGGTNRTSGQTVQGVGAGNREQIERIFFRAFTQYLPPSATFALARQATQRAAGELYGDGSAAARAINQAWSAVGVN